MKTQSLFQIPDMVRELLDGGPAEHLHRSPAQYSCHYACLPRAYPSMLRFQTRFDLRYLGNMLKIVLGLSLTITLSQIVRYESGDMRVLRPQLCALVYRALCSSAWMP